MIPYATLRDTLAARPLFEAKTWQLSPEPWPLTEAQAKELEAIGTACLEFHQALETLYLRSVAGKNLLRNKTLQAPWVAEYLDRGKPPELILHARDPKNRGALPTVLRPDLLLTDEGFVLTELDSVPGGIGLTAFLNRLYGGQSTAAVALPPDQSPNAAPGSSDGAAPAKDASILGAGDAMIRHFHASLAALRPSETNPLIALVVSEEAATYRPEMEWIAQQLQLLGRRVFCLKPEQLFPLGGALFFDLEGNPEKIDVLYRFFELFDLSALRTAPFFFEAWKNGELAIAPPMRPFQEEKIALALFHHPRLCDYWMESLSRPAHALLSRLIPQSWILDAAPLPPGAVLHGPTVGGRPLGDWRDLAHASQKERDLIIKISGFHETAWGARSVVLGSDCSREEWVFGLERALQLAPSHLHVLQAYRKPRRVRHTLYRTSPTKEVSGLADTASIATSDGRLRLCPYYFVHGGRTHLSGALATFCPPDKKIIHGMQDAALLPCAVARPSTPPSSS